MPVIASEVRGYALSPGQKSGANDKALARISLKDDVLPFWTKIGVLCEK